MSSNKSGALRPRFRKSTPVGMRPAAPNPGAGSTGSRGEAHGKSFEATRKKEETPTITAIVEEPNEDSERGLERPRLEQPTLELMDARDRGWLARVVTIATIGPILLFGIAMIVATFTGVDLAGLESAAEWVTAQLMPLATLALGYYLGSHRMQTR